MKEGFWLNRAVTRPFPIGLRGDHERWIRETGNAKMLGVPRKVVAQFGKFQPEADRDKFLLFVMQHAPVMRVRGHGSFVTFEYWTLKNDGDAKQAVRRFAKRFLGPMTGLNIVNLARIRMPRQKFHDARHGVENP